MKVSSEIKRRYDLIHVLTTTRKPNLHDMHRATGIPASTIKRQLAAIRVDFGMKILFIREPSGERGTSGYYILTDWGIIDRKEFAHRYPSML